LRGEVNLAASYRCSVQEVPVLRKSIVPVWRWLFLVAPMATVDLVGVRQKGLGKGEFANIRAISRTMD